MQDMERPKQRLALVSIISCAMFVPVLAHATDQYDDWIPWWGGAGLKTFENCDNSAYFVNGMQNYDHGNNNQSAYMSCANIGESVNVQNTSHNSCQDRSVAWTGGAGLKAWSFCPNGKYAVGFQINDYGSNNQAIKSMRCCAIAGIATHHEDSYETVVDWWGGSGYKTMERCDEGYYVTGIRNQDHGNNDQSVGQIRCSAPVPN